MFFRKMIFQSERRFFAGHKFKKKKQTQLGQFLMRLVLFDQKKIEFFKNVQTLLVKISVESIKVKSKS
jgi:hypothetical protein